MWGDYRYRLASSSQKEGESIVHQRIDVDGGVRGELGPGTVGMGCSSLERSYPLLKETDTSLKEWKILWDDMRCRIS